MYISEMTTQHFHFVAAGRSPESADRVLLHAFRANLVRNGASREARDQWTVNRLKHEWGVRDYHINVGDGFCDGEKVVS